MRRSADRGQRHRDAGVVQGFDQFAHAGLGRHFIDVEVLDDVVERLADGLLREAQIVGLFEVPDAFVDGHGPHGRIELLFLLLREFDALGLQELRVEVLPDGHGVDQRAVDVEDGGFEIAILNGFDQVFHKFSASTVLALRSSVAALRSSAA